MEDEQAVNLHVPGVSPGADEAQMTDQALQGPSDASRAAAPASPAPKRCGKTLIGVFIGASYFLVYFWRTPIFMLPLDILRQEVTTLFGRALDLQSCFSMAYILGFGCAKVPAVRFMSSGFFFRHRLAVHAALLCGSMLTECLGILIFSFSPKLQVRLHSGFYPLPRSGCRTRPAQHPLRHPRPRPGPLLPCPSSRRCCVCSSAASSAAGSLGAS